MIATPRPTLLTVIARRWPVIVRNAVIATVVVAGLSLLMHNQHTATTEVLPPDTQSDLSPGCDDA